MDLLTLTSDTVLAQLDPGRGADILSLVDRESGTDVMFSTPWRERADDIRANRMSPTTVDSASRWIEQYRGGWQTACPNAGPPREFDGAPWGFHGETALASWKLLEQTTSSARLLTELYTAPLRIERSLTLVGDTLAYTDTITNLSAREVEVDYLAHPAFGGAFLEGDCVIDTSARTFVVDPNDERHPSAAGLRTEWPWLGPPENRIDLRRVVPPSDTAYVFGWLTDFDEAWASITNRDCGLTVLIAWDARILPFAWLWEELNHSPGFPWFGRARVVAIEPSSTQTSGPDRRSVLTLSAGGSITIPMAVSIRHESQEGERS